MSARLLRGFPMNYARRWTGTTRISASVSRPGDKLKAYVIRSVNSGNKRQFEVKQDAVPLHRWTKNQKMAVYIAAAVIAVILCIVIPLAESYYNMRKEEGFKDWRKTEEAGQQTAEVVLEEELEVSLM